MRRLTSSHRERGFSGIVVGILAPALIAAVGLSIDSGSLVLQRGNVQKAADAAAMAIGQDCAAASRQGASTAVKNRCTASGAASTAQLMLNGNAPGATASALSGLNPGLGTATITVSKSVQMTFGAAIGINPKTATASSTVTWAQVPTAATTFPLGVSICDYYRWKAAPSETHKLYRYDAYQGGLLGGLFADNCTSPTGQSVASAKGALWLVGMSAWFNSGGCTVSTSIGFTGSISSTNLLFPTSCADRARALVVGKTYLLPVYSSPTFIGLVTSLFPTIRGYVPFVMTGWRIGGSINSGLVEKQDSAAPTCSYSVLFSNVCRGIQGYITGSIIPLDEVDSYGVNPDADFGSVRVKITS